MNLLTVIHVGGVVVVIERGADRSVQRRTMPECATRKGTTLSREMRRKLAREERRQKPGEMKN